MNKFLFFIVLIISISCNNNQSSTTVEAKKTDIPTTDTLSSEDPVLNSDTIKKIELGFADKFEKFPQLTFEAITEKEFLSVKSKTYLQTFQPKQKGNSFFVQTKLQKHAFKKYMDYGGDASWSGFECLGYYPATKLFVLTENSTSDHFGFGELFLLDSITDYTYRIISFGDGSVEVPIPSINNSYFVYYYNSMYESKVCDLGVLKVNDKTHPKNYLSERASYHSEDFSIEQIVWKTDNSFLMKTFVEVIENNQRVKKYSYYKTIID